ncbi:HAD family hydrolase [Alginatibacterium sediminis]|uniref:HAD family hydrolase n=1 Tax=Alginatibacterium sediminis TaxID=2164068 RepID=A0A420ENC5_9ALTE|nr:HAD-IA family hydrolase [Alginatibacterium sediminis]RKF22094.1 HAD family hydrolase [Alginatibacterium sediminis]
MICYRPWKTTSALSFDLDDTLYSNGDVIRNAQSWLMGELKNQCREVAHWGNSDWAGLRRQTLLEQPHLRQDVTELRRQWLLKGLNQHGVVNAKAYVEHLLDGFIVQRSQVSIADEVLELLEHLQKKYRLIAITNGNIDCKIAGLDGFFETVIQAGSGIAAKPQSQPFEIASQALGLSAQDITHIGDHPYYDVLGAINAGYQAIWLDNGDRRQKIRCLPHLHIHSILDLSKLL